MHRIYRIDMHLNAFGGGVSSLNNKTGDLTVSAGTGIGVTPTTDGLQISNSGVTSVNGDTGAVDLSNTYYTQTEVDNLVGFSNMEVFTTSTTWTVPAGVTKVKVYVTGGGSSGYHDSSLNQSHTGYSGSTAIGIFSVTGGSSQLSIIIGQGAADNTNSTTLVGGGNSSVGISDRTGSIIAPGGYSVTGNPSNTMSGVVGDLILLNSFRGSIFKDQLTASNSVLEGSPSYWGSGRSYGSGAAMVNGTQSLDAGNGIVVVEY